LRCTTNMTQRAREILLQGSPGRRTSTLILVALLLAVIIPAAAASIGNRTVFLAADQAEWQMLTKAETVGEVLLEAGIMLAENDRVVPELESPVTEGGRIEVIRSFPVTVAVDGQEITLPAAAESVRQLLAGADIALGPQDRLEPGADMPVAPGMTVRVVRITEQIAEETRIVPAPIEQQVDYSLERGIQRTVQVGKSGQIREKIRVILEDGQEVGRQVLETAVIRPPVTQIVAMGGLASVSRGGERIDFTRAMEMVATAYSYNAGAYTSTGERVRVGGIAVDPRVIPYGTRLYVENYGYATAIDCGGAIKGNRIDVFLESEQECRRWGVRRLKVYVLD